MTSLLRDFSLRTAGPAVRRICLFGGVAEPDAWAAADWNGATIPYLALGMLTTLVTASLVAPARRGSAILRR
jgi:hypothetical protein